MEVLLKDKNGGNRLRFLSAFSAYNDAKKKKKVQVFSSSWAFFSLCNRKNQSDQNPGRTQPKLFPKGEL